MTTVIAACASVGLSRGYSGIEAVMAEMAGSGAAQRVVIVAPRSGQAVSVGRGEQVRVLDADGHQVGDMWAIDAADPGRWLSASHTRDRCERLFPAVGEQFRDQYGVAILQLAADTSPGLHDMLFPPCDRWLYESRRLAGHANCRDNFLAAVASAGISLPVVPDPVNLFQDSGPQPDGRLRIGVAASRPGDAISFLAQRDLVFVLTACSVCDDLFVPAQGEHPLGALADGGQAQLSQPGRFDRCPGLTREVR